MGVDQMCRENMLETNCLTAVINTDRRVENTTRRGLFMTNLERLDKCLDVI